jgi:hypothetical protein
MSGARDRDSCSGIPTRRSNPILLAQKKLGVADCGMRGAGLAMIAFGIYGFIMAAG